jgi:putative ABC transport system permease protein
MTPPRLAGLLLRLLLPRALHEPIAGDLEEEWRASPRPSRRRFWSLALRSIAACWIDDLRPDRRRGGRAVAPPAASHQTGDTAVHILLQDLRYGLRLMRRHAGFTLAVVATLALGIGANAAIFSIVNVLSLKPLSYRDPGRVAFVVGWDVERDAMRFNMRHADYLDLQRQAQSFEALAAYTYLSANLTGGDLPDRVQAYRVTPNTFALLGVDAALGRAFGEADAASGRFDLAVISHGLWQRRFGGDPAIVGRPIVVNGQPYEVAGVMPPRFEYPVFNFKGDLWLPWQMRDSGRGQAGATGSATVVGRLRPGISYGRAQAEIDVLMRTLADEHPGTNRTLGARVIEMGALDDAQAGPAAAILLVTVAMVLVLACANVANLLLARGVSRQRELAVRAAMGASRRRIGRQLLVEGALLALAGGTAGVACAWFALQGIRASLPDALLSTMPNIEDLGIDTATLTFALVVSLLTSVMFGVLPAWRATREQFDGALKESSSAGGSRGTRRLRTALVVAEVALATMLLVGAGLLVRSYSGLRRVDPGFDPSGVMTLATTLPDYRYADGLARLRFFEQAIEEVERLPGVTSAGFVNVLPLSTYDRGTRVAVEGAPPPEPGREPSASLRVASPRYHETLRIPLVEGRYFDRRDSAEGLPVAIVNQTFVRRHLAGGAPPVGRRIRTAAADAPWLTIVGVVDDVRHSALDAQPDAEVYLPMSQAPAAMMMIAVRTAGRAEDLTGPIRGVIGAIDATQPVYHVKTLEALVEESTLASRASANTVALFGVLALLLAGIGIYGVVAYGVSQQTREFGVRIALGATPRDLLRLVLGSGSLMVGAGIALGMAGALGVSRLMSSVLYGVSPTDPVTYAGVIAVLALTGLAACLAPAWRAARTRAATALRSE